MRASILFAMVLPLLSPIHRLSAQNISSLAQGAKIRVEPVKGRTTTGLLVGIDGDSLRYTPLQASSRPEAVHVRDIREIRVSQGRSRGHGARVTGGRGLGLGALAGGILGGAFYKDSKSCGLFRCSTREEDVIGTAVFGGLVGAVAGLIYGAAAGREKWEPVLNLR